MPTISAHVSEEEAKAVEVAAAAAPEGKPSPYVREAVLQRLDREGLLPGSNGEDVARVVAKVTAAVRKDPALIDRIEAVLSKSTRRHMAPVV